MDIRSFVGKAPVIPSTPAPASGVTLFGDQDRLHSHIKIDPLPLSLLDKIAINESEKIVFTDLRTSGTPLFLTWINKNKRRQVNMQVQVCEISKVSQLREQGFTQKSAFSQNNDLHVRTYAVDLITEASKYGASDIHLMMRGTHAEIQFEIEGKLYHFATLHHGEGGAIARAIFQGIAKTKAAMFEELALQNAQISGSEFPPECKISSCRIIRGPAFSLGSGEGSFMTIRLQYLTGHQKGEGLPSLSYPKRPDGVFRLGNMGYSQAQIEKLELLMSSPSGATLFIGPVGSGKTSSLYQILEQLARLFPYSRQVCIEDPVENPLAWAVQMVITNAKNDEEVGVEFANLVRTALRMSPKKIFLGEIRGPAVALSVIEAALTGHQLWSTIHAPDPFMAIDRVELMDPSLLSRKRFCDHNIIRGLIAQRLLPRLCPHCKVSLNSNESVLPSRLLKALRSHGNAAQVYVAKEGGCEYCSYTGSAGRFAVAEVVVCDETLMNDFIHQGTAIARRNYRARDDADAPLIDQSLVHVFGGIVDPRDVEEHVQAIPVRKARIVSEIDELLIEREVLSA